MLWEYVCHLLHVKEIQLLYFTFLMYTVSILRVQGGFFLLLLFFDLWVRVCVCVCVLSGGGGGGRVVEGWRCTD